MKTTSSAVHVLRTYRLTDVSDADTVRDSSRCPITPTQATVQFVDYTDGRGLRPRYVEIEGRRQAGEKTQGTFSRGGFSIVDGAAADRHDGDVPPAWVHDVVALARAEQSAAGRTRV